MRKAQLDIAAALAETKSQEPGNTGGFQQLEKVRKHSSLESPGRNTAL